MRLFLTCIIHAAYAAGTPAISARKNRQFKHLISIQNAQEIPDNYIIVFKSGVNEEEVKAHHTWIEGQRQELLAASSKQPYSYQLPFLPSPAPILPELRHTYNITGDFVGYSGQFSLEVIENLRQLPEVEYSNC